MALLEIHSLSVAFPSGNGSAPVPVIDDVSLSLGAREALGLIGESASGKTLLALSMLRMAPPPGRIVSGRILWKGRDLSTLPKEALRKIRGREMALVPQEASTALNPVLTIGRQVAEPLEVHEKMSRKQALARAVELLEEVGIPEPSRRARDYPHQLSGGMKQRALIAAALAASPDLLIADEPTSALDLATQARILELLLRVREERGLSLLLISHDLGALAETADRVAVMYAGKIVEIGPARSIFRSPLHPYTEGLLRSLPRPDPAGKGKRRLAALAGSVPPPEARPTGCAFAPRCPSRFEPCEHDRPALVEIRPERLASCFRAEADGPS